MLLDDPPRRAWTSCCDTKLMQIPLRLSNSSLRPQVASWLTSTRHLCSGNLLTARSAKVHLHSISSLHRDIDPSIVQLIKRTTLPPPSSRFQSSVEPSASSDSMPVPPHLSRSARLVFSHWPRTNARSSWRPIAIRSPRRQASLSTPQRLMRLSSNQSAVCGRSYLHRPLQRTMLKFRQQKHAAWNAARVSLRSYRVR